MSAQNGEHSEPLLTRVALIFVEQRLNIYLRFGHPVHEQRRDRWRRTASFGPDAVFCRILWEANAHGTTAWQLLVLQAGQAFEGIRRIQGVEPGAHLLLRATGERQVQAILQQIDAIEALGVDPATVSVTYWRTLYNRLVARMALPTYTPERHAAFRAQERIR